MITKTYVLYYIGTLYSDYQAGFRMGLMLVAFAFASAFPGRIAYRCFILPSYQYKDWQILYLVQNVVTLLISALALAVLITHSDTAWYLTG